MEQHLISDVKHGFVKQRSSLTQHLTFFIDLTVHYESNTPCDIIYLDFATAFDSVSHNKLNTLFKNIKISSSILSWIEDFSSGRTQQTCEERILSTPSKVTSGIPKGFQFWSNSFFDFD